MPHSHHQCPTLENAVKFNDVFHQDQDNSKGTPLASLNVRREPCYYVHDFDNHMSARPSHADFCQRNGVHALSQHLVG